MREFSKTKPVKFSLTLLLIAALFIAALSPLAFIDNTASAEAWASNTQYTYALGFSSPQPNTITTVVSQSGTTYDTGIPASLGAILPNEEGYEFVGFEINPECRSRGNRYCYIAICYYNSIGLTCRNGILQVCQPVEHR